MLAVEKMTQFNQHTPVLLQEAVEGLVTDKDGVYIDATFGRGSHALQILSRLSANGRLIAFDKDLAAVQYAAAHIHDPRFSIFHCSYARLQFVMQELNLIAKVQGVLFDLGVSSPQLDDEKRGFSFVREGKLDMRMDQRQTVTAETFLATVDEETLASVLWQYGEEKQSRRIARAIIEARKVTPITTTTMLADLVQRVCGQSYRTPHKHPATRVFQAIRIAVNEELSDLEKGLEAAFNVLAVSGRLAVISFHSLEDRIVKQFMAHHEKGAPILRGLPIKEEVALRSMRKVAGPIKPSIDEMNSNRRARSAVLRISEKLI